MIVKTSGKGGKQMIGISPVPDQGFHPDLADHTQTYFVNVVLNVPYM